MKNIKINSIGDLKIFIKNELDRIQKNVKFNIELNAWFDYADDEFSISLSIYDKNDNNEIFKHSEIVNSKLNEINSRYKVKSVIPFCYDVNAVISAFLDKNNDINTIKIV